MGVYNRTRSCFKTETEILEWEEIDGMTEEESMSHFGKDQLCGTDRVFYGWGGLMNGSLEARVEKNCHDRICMIAYTQIPVWTLVSIAVLYGIIWEIYDAYKRSKHGPSIPAEYYAAAQQLQEHKCDKRVEQAMIKNV